MTSAVCNLLRLTALMSFQSFNSLTIRIELDFKSEYLFRMCSVVTNLVTSLEFSANPLCYFAVSLWTDTERLRSHQNHSPQ